MGGILDRFFPDDPALSDALEHSVHLWVAGIVLALMAFLIAIKKGLGSATAV